MGALKEHKSSCCPLKRGDRVKIELSGIYSMDDAQDNVMTGTVKKKLAGNTWAIKLDETNKQANGKKGVIRYCLKKHLTRLRGRVRERMCHIIDPSTGRSPRRTRDGQH